MEAAIDAGTSGVGRSRHKASVRFSDSQVPRQRPHPARCASIVAHTVGSISPSRCCEKSVRTSGQGAPRDGSSIAVPEEGGERLSNRHSGSVKAALDRVDADAQDFRHFWSRQTLDVAEHEHLALRGLEPVDRASQRTLELAIRGGLLRAWPRIGQALGGIDSRRVERLLSRGRELAAPPLLDAEAAGDGIQPARHRGVAAEVAQGARHRNQALLRDVAGVVLVAAHPKAEAVQAGLIADQQRLQRRGVPLPGRRQQFGVGRRTGRMSGRSIRSHRRDSHTAAVVYGKSSMGRTLCRRLAPTRRDPEPGDDTVTRTPGRGIATVLFLCTASVGGVVPVAFAQTSLTLEEAMKRAQGRDGRRTGARVDGRGSRGARAGGAVGLLAARRSDRNRAAREQPRLCLQFAALPTPIHGRELCDPVAQPSRSRDEHPYGDRNSATGLQRGVDHARRLGRETGARRGNGRARRRRAGSRLRRGTGIRAGPPARGGLYERRTAPWRQRRAITSGLAPAATSASRSRRMCWPLPFTWRTCTSGRLPNAGISRSPVFGSRTLSACR